ncbi:hypothetical protein [Nonomuraea diastatica]|uniref:hypothetical protein n=1 Tax=Nonomuraea diastatica TaxID=1848329 RepID=UPI00140CAAF7|nr:hypothetical protein [Nonomuraea diastatica]
MTHVKWAYAIVRVRLQGLTVFGARLYHAIMEIRYPVENDDFQRDDVKVFTVSQGEVGVSRSGTIDIYTTGFAGCTGVIITSKEGRGALVAHVSQLGHGIGRGVADDEEKRQARKKNYLIEATQGALNLAKNHFADGDALSLALVHGMKSDPDFADELTTENPALVHVQDIRADRSRAALLYLDTREKALYLWGTTQDDHFDKIVSGVEQFEEDPPKCSAQGTLALVHATNGMSWHLYD